MPRCEAVTSVKRGLWTHSVKCQHDAGHEGSHECREGGRHVVWFGPAIDTTKTDTRWRFGLKPQS